MCCQGEKFFDIFSFFCWRGWRNIEKLEKGNLILSRSSYCRKVFRLKDEETKHRRYENTENAQGKVRIEIKNSLTIF